MNIINRTIVPLPHHTTKGLAVFIKEARARKLMEA